MKKSDKRKKRESSKCNSLQNTENEIKNLAHDSVLPTAITWLWSVFLSTLHIRAFYVLGTKQ
jgi:hypothetical protein